MYTQIAVFQTVANINTNKTNENFQKIQEMNYRRTTVEKVCFDFLHRKRLKKLTISLIMKL